MLVDGRVMSRQASKPKGKPIMQKLADSQTFKMALVNASPSPGPGRPRQYNPPSKRYGCHRFKNDVCPCGYERQPVTLVHHLMEVLRGERQSRVFQAAAMLQKEIQEKCDSTSNEPFVI
jgi:hypothetical protein